MEHVWGLTVEVTWIQKIYRQLKDKGVNPRTTEILDSFNEEEKEYLAWVKETLSLVTNPSNTNIGNK